MSAAPSCVIVTLLLLPNGILASQTLLLHRELRGAPNFPPPWFRLNCFPSDDVSLVEHGGLTCFFYS